MRFSIPITLLVSLLFTNNKVLSKPTQDIGFGSSENGNTTILIKKSTIGGLQSISDIRYVESLSEIQNPYRGFFKQMKVTLKRDNTKSSTDSIPVTPLVRILVDISDFQNNSLSNNAINYLRNIFENLKQKQKSMVLRFAYDPGYKGKDTKEPSMSMVLKHQEGLRQLIEDYADAIASVECGLFGAYGEMHSSSVYTGDKERKKYVISTIDKWLEVLPKSITLSVRKPEFYCDWNNVDQSKISENITKEKQSAYRVGIYNDGYLASYSDLGTFKNRDEEIKWLSNQSKHTLYGGEFGNYKKKEMRNVAHTAKYMEKEAYLTHTSYLNLGWYKDTVDGMKSENYSGKDQRYKGTSGFQFIENHLGYRFVVRGVRLTKSVESNGLFGIESDIENVGFANLIKPKTIVFIMVNGSNRFTITNMESATNSNPSQWDSKTTTTFKSEILLPSNMPTGKYKVYLRIASGRSSKGLNGYPIRFANDDKNLWNESLGANYLGEFTVVGNSKNNAVNTKSNTNTNANANSINSKAKSTASKTKTTTLNKATKTAANKPTVNDTTVTNNAVSHKSSSSASTSSTSASSKATKYLTLKFKGTLKNTTNYYLGVSELKESASFNLHKEDNGKSNKYRTWHVTSMDRPSLLYLSDGTYGNHGEPSNLCLDLGEYKSSDGYNYLRVVKCSQAQYKFMYGGSYRNSIDIYNRDGEKHLTDKQGNKLCLYYSMTPRISKCKNTENNQNIGWEKHIL